MQNHFDVLIIGGGTAGIMVCAQLLRKNSKLSIGIIEPNDTHYYQPAWTLVGADTYAFEDTARPMRSLIPDGVHWVKEYATDILSEKNTVSTNTNKQYSYDYLVICPGLRMAPELVEGLSDALDKGVVCSIYTDPNFTKDVLNTFKGGVALFTQPTTPIKCGGAPQKIMYLAEDIFRKNDVAHKTDIVFATPGTVIFGLKKIAHTLMKVVDRKDINLRFGYRLVGIDGQKKVAWYTKTDHEYEYNHKEIDVVIDGDRIGIKFDMVHLAPPQASPKFIANSSLSNDEGWLTVNKETLQHDSHNNIFGLGDVANLPTAKTGAAVRKQVPIVVDNILSLIQADMITSHKYNGYSSCPIVTGFGKMVLAEFDYENNFTPDPKLKQLLIFDSAKELWRLWILKKYILPHLYWNKMMKGIDV